MRELVKLASADGRLWYFVTAILAAMAICLQINGFSRSGWDLTAKLRKIQFAAVVRHDISWFDEEKNSVGDILLPEVLG
jgi:ATP-binding cassette subfamily B (MDR/TAP) protein 1